MVKTVMKKITGFPPRCASTTQFSLTHTASFQFCSNPHNSFCIIWFMNKQTNQQTDRGENITSLAEVKTETSLCESMFVHNMQQLTTYPEYIASFFFFSYTPQSEYHTLCFTLITILSTIAHSCTGVTFYWFSIGWHFGIWKHWAHILTEMLALPHLSAARLRFPLESESPPPLTFTVSEQNDQKCLVVVSLVRPWVLPLRLLSTFYPCLLRGGCGLECSL